MKNIAIALCIFSVLFIATTSHAYTNYYKQRSPSYQDTQTTDPVDDIKTALDKLEQFSSNAETATPVVLRSFIENEIIPHFSFEDMTRWITGPYAQRMTRTDKEDFQQRLKEAFLNSMVRHLGNLKNIKDRVRFYPTRFRGYNEARVSSKVYRDNSYPVNLDFRMRHIDGSWKIVDVKANGTSAVVYYRQHFIDELRQYPRKQAAPATRQQPPVSRQGAESRPEPRVRNPGQ